MKITNAAKRADVVVIGGGPSGLRAAGRLAARGLDVRLFERKPRIGQNVICTGIVGKEVFEKFGLNPASIIREIRTVRLVSPFSTVVTYQHPRSFAFVVDREAFDGHIAESAAAAGATIELNCRVQDIAVGPAGVTVTARSDKHDLVTCEAEVAVIASGIDYALQKKVGLGYPMDFLNGAQAEISDAAGDVTSIFFGKSVAPGAFAWSVPAAEGKIRVGLLTKREPKAVLQKLLDERFREAVPSLDDVQIRTKAVAQGLLSRTAAERVLSVGEAAGQIKTTTGGGISYGLLCADLASEVIAECFAKSDFGAQSLAVYESRWRKALQKEITVGQYTRKMCSRLSDWQVEGLFHLAQTDGIIPIIRDTADFDWHSGLIMALLKRLSFMGFFKAMKEHLGPESLS